MSAPTPPTDFRQFLRGVQLDGRLSHYLPGPIEQMTPESLCLSLLVALADCAEWKQLHPAIATLENLEAGR